MSPYFISTTQKKGISSKHPLPVAVLTPAPLRAIMMAAAGQVGSLFGNQGALWGVEDPSQRDDRRSKAHH
jgi:hypothetical protein